MKHTLSITVDNKPGVLARISGLFSRRGFNIDSLAVGTSERPEISRMTIVIDVESQPLEQVAKQLHKLINVLKLIRLEPGKSVERELMLVKVGAKANQRTEISEIVNIFRGKIIDMGASSITAEVTGTTDKLLALVELLKPFEIIEIARTGKVALIRGE